MTNPKDATREALPEPLKVVAWAKVSKEHMPRMRMLNESYVQGVWNDPLVRLTDAQSALESERQAHAAEVERLRADAERYKQLRRGQHWSVINGIGDVLRDEQLDAAIDQAIARGKT